MDRLIALLMAILCVATGVPMIMTAWVDENQQHLWFCGAIILLLGCSFLPWLLKKPICRVCFKPLPHATAHCC